MDNLAVGCLFVLGLTGLLYLLFRYWLAIILVAAVLLVAGICYAVIKSTNPTFHVRVKKGRIP
jgi:hypothetical protein